MFRDHCSVETILIDGGERASGKVAAVGSNMHWDNFFSQVAPRFQRSLHVLCLRDAT